MNDLDAIRARAANIASGSVYSQPQTADDYQALLAEIDRRTTDLMAEQSVRQEEWDHASELLKDGVKSVSHWERETVAARGERDRYRLAWLSARGRAARLADSVEEATQGMAGDLYRAEDRLAFVREMCDLADREQRPITTEQVRAWANYEGCANATPDGAGLAQSFAVALAAMQPGAEPVFCHHEHRTVQWRTKGGITTATTTCSACPARAESTEGEPVLAPYLLNAERCTDACAERHTNGPGCLMAPDWSKLILRRKP